ncbi:uncharacterized protein B0H18DRAFT_1038749 [Fomitopsis serialis]|uniref:uncharacterized protein n=1 Tax=Fomitopsis serialis TaxID=139415 RepID=UPI002008155A|nr:uncharacterized protein B0H18DRAFT_1038749 [Neoantrodia serialis]KAH9916193.1 hypothetical protein B0H18DRAFT_1038749 [Neoantrodia serialis]
MPVDLAISKITARDVLHLAVDVAAATQELANLASFPPAAIAAGMLLEIFQTIQKIQTNKADCGRLANRCLSILCRTRDQMEGRWVDAPPSLLKALKAFETTLENIQVFLAGEASKNWRTRLQRKSTIEKALASLATQLDDAERSFQIATLINIHRAVGDERKRVTSAVRKTENSCSGAKSTPVGQTTHSEFIASQGTATRKDSDMSDTSTLVDLTVSQRPEVVQPVSKDTVGSTSDVVLEVVPVARCSGPQSVESQTSLSVASSPKLAFKSAAAKVKAPAIDDEGFRRYHQSDLVLRGRSRVQDGWWAGVTQAEVDGRRVLVKRYEGPRDATSERWRRDVDILRHVHDTDMARMLGYSRDECPTPFIVLANNTSRLPDGLF